MKALRCTALGCLLLLTSSVFAADPGDPPPPPHGEGRRGPPRMFDASACKGIAAGATVESTMPDGSTVRGTSQLMFVPERPACEGK